MNYAECSSGITSSPCLCPDFRKPPTLYKSLDDLINVIDGEFRSKLIESKTELNYRYYRNFNTKTVQQTSVQASTEIFSKYSLGNRCPADGTYANSTLHMRKMRWRGGIHKKLK